MSGDSHGSVLDDESHEEHEEHVNHEAWVIPYADLLTLLMAMFIALFAISTVDLEKFKKLAEGFNDALGGNGVAAVSVLDGGAGGILDGGAAPTTPTTAVTPGAGGAEDPTSPAGSQKILYDLGAKLQTVEAQSAAQLQGVQQQIESRASGAGLTGNLSFRLEDRGLVVTVVTDQVLFSSGSAALTAPGEALLGVVGQALNAVPNGILVEGHTDAIPISGGAYPSNWELSSARAGAVVRYFEQGAAMAPSRLTATGFGEQRAIDTNVTDAGRARNRRVEVIVQGIATEQRDVLLDEAAQASERLATTAQD